MDIGEIITDIEIVRPDELETPKAPAEPVPAESHVDAVTT